MTEPTTYQRTEKVQAIIFDPDVKPWPEEVVATEDFNFSDWRENFGLWSSPPPAVLRHDGGRLISPVYAGDRLILSRGFEPPGYALQVIPKDKWAAQGWLRAVVIKLDRPLHPTESTEVPSDG